MDQVDRLENEIFTLRKTLQCKEQELYELKQKILSVPPNHNENGYLNQKNNTTSTAKVQISSSLPKWAIERYSRQILLPHIGVQGQEKLIVAKVLIVGAGGLGCPAAVYLAGAGVGEIGIVDYDLVDITNIHRQILHEEKDENTSKAESVAASLRSLNSKIKVTSYNVQLDSKNALQIVSNYDLILDCTDNVPTRYLLNDVCVMAKLPLISGSALKMEGQLTLYGYRAERNTLEKDSGYIGPCYRCVFPTPPPPEAVGSCSANGVAGPIPGVIGALQALEAIKLIVGQTHESLLVERMLLFDGEDVTFRNVRLRNRNAQCEVCSTTPTITCLLDYEAVCKTQAKEKKKHEARLKSQRRQEGKAKRMTGQSYLGFRTKIQEDKKKWIQDVPKGERKIGSSCNSSYCAKDLDLHLLPPEHRISATQLAEQINQLDADTDGVKQRHLLVDVRSDSEFLMCKIDGAVNYPIDNLQRHLNELIENIKCSGQVTFICRRGNDSQIAAKKVLDVISKEYKQRIKDLTGGLHAWAKYVDHEFPIY